MRDQLGGVTRGEDGVRFGPMLKVSNLKMAFGGLLALDGASLEVAEGSITGLIGPNGAGKTTLFNCVAGALKPSGGDVLLDGETITGLPTHELFHRGVVRTFQIPHEFGQLTVLENLMVVPPVQPGESLISTWIRPSAVKAHEAEVRERAEDALAFLSLTHVRDELAGNLSSGQKKLLEIGRTMMAEPRIVLLDEPGAGVNPTLLGKIAEMILRLNQDRGYTFCLIEHDMELIERLTDPVIVLAEGRVLVKGDFASIRKDPRVLNAYLGGEGAA